MGNILSRPISKIEHGIHILLLFLTGGGWILFYIARIVFYKNKSKVQAGTSKDRILSKVDKINLKQTAPSGSATYVKRTFASEEQAEDDDWYEYAEPYSFEIVGESYKREKLLTIIEKHNAFQIGELELEAVLKMESNNKFDPTAVAVFIEGKPVGYIPSDYSLDVTSYMDDLNVTSVKLKARIGWDTSNPDPAIGVRLDFNF
tara:strand:- start:295 stop:903 length:609 start_codon:yes stop_codon:yes gene_type:complete